MFEQEGYDLMGAAFEVYKVGLRHGRRDLPTKFGSRAWDTKYPVRCSSGTKCLLQGVSDQLRSQGRT